MNEKRPRQVIIVPVVVPVTDPRRTALRGAAIVGGRSLRRPLLIRRADVVSGEIIVPDPDPDRTARVRRGG